MGRLVPAHHPRVVARGRLWRCWPTPTWRWYGIRHRRRDVWEKRGLPQFGRKADTADGARGSAVTLPADMETPPYGRISAAVVPVETAAPGNGPALSLPTPPETPHHISATVVLNQSQGGMCICGAMKIGLVTPVKPSHPYLENDPAPLFDLHCLRISPWLWFRMDGRRSGKFPRRVSSAPPADLPGSGLPPSLAPPGLASPTRRSRRCPAQ